MAFRYRPFLAVTSITSAKVNKQKLNYHTWQSENSHNEAIQNRVLSTERGILQRRATPH